MKAHTAAPRRIAVLSTGGTIAMQHDTEAHGAIPRLNGQDLAAGLPDCLPSLQVDAVLNVPSAHLTLDDLWTIRERVLAWIEQPDIAGVVITHGTDTLEETAYLLDLTVSGAKPVVLTGAMRTASDLGYEGRANLAAAIQVAASDAARGLGALVVLNDEIHAARHVTKMHTQNPATFQSPAYGPLGYVNPHGVRIAYRLAPEHVIPNYLEKGVGLIKLAVGMDHQLFDALVKAGYGGIVIEALGGGRVPPLWMPGIRQAIDQGVWIAITSRCPGGPVGDRYGYPGAYRDLREAGALFAQGLNGQKARIKLMAVLGAFETDAQIRGRFA